MWMKCDIVTQWVTAHGESYAPLCRACPGTGEKGLNGKSLSGACSGFGQLTREVPHEQSLANSSLAKSTGKTGNGGPKLDGARAQALY